MSNHALAAAARRVIEEGRLDVARPMWSRLCELEPNETDHWIILSAIDEHLGFLPAALEHIAYAARLDADDPDVWLQAAKVRWRMRDLQGAISDLGQALALDFRIPEARLLYGAWLLEWHRFVEALVHYRFLQRAGIDLPYADIVKAAACAWCAVDRYALEAISAAPARAAGGRDALADAVARELRTLLAPGERQPIEASWKAAIAGNAFGASIQRRLDEDECGFDWRAFFERRAHVHAVLADDALAKVHETMARDLANRVPLLRGRALRVLDLGCGTGRLGEALADFGDGLLLTGIDCCGEMIRVSNGGNRYDNLLCAAIEDSGVLEIIAGADCIVLADVLPYCSDPSATATLVIENASPSAMLWMAWEPDTPGIDGLGAAVRGAAHARGRDCTVVDIPGRAALMVGGRRITDGSEPKAGPLQCRMDEFERTANRLVEAERQLAAARFDECREASLGVLRVFPRSSQALFHLGVEAQHCGRLDDALYWFRQALRLRTGFAAAWFHVGATYQHKNASTLAAHAYRQCIRRDPGNFASLHNLAALERARGNHDAAWRVQRALLARHPLGVEPYIAELKQTLDRLDDRERRRELDEFLEGGDWLRARLRQALERKYVSRVEKLLARLSDAGGGEAELLFYRAQLAEKSGDPDSAVSHGMTLLRHDRRSPVYWQFVASACAAGGRLETSRRLWRAAASAAGPDSQVLQNRLFFLNYSPVLSAAGVAALHRDWGRALAVHVDARRTAPSRRRGRQSRIRIGYVSADFRMHSVAVFLYNILKHRDRDRFEVFCYCSTPVQDAMTTKLRLFSDAWRDIRLMSDDDSARLIERDRIDVLVDLSGHTAGNRLPVFCRKPAPVQCTYLGYPNTTGLTEIDYRITDSDADPVGMTERLHTEKLVRLPSGFLSYSRHARSTPVTVYRNRNSARHYTFACCNNIYKVNDNVIDVWAAILRHLPNSRLLIKAHNLNNDSILDRYRISFEKRGIDVGQVHLMNTIDNTEHQNLYNHIDIALDPFPYNGTTTTCDALWMGVPVLTLAGDRHAARVGASIMRRIGLPEWVAESEADYLDKAVRYAVDTEYLRHIRLGMRERLRSSTLMRPEAVVRDLEVAYGAWVLD